MKFIFLFLSQFINLPARIKGMKIGRRSILGPGYDFWFVRLRGVVLGKDVVIGRNAWIQIAGSDPSAKVVIGDGANLGRNLSISAKREVRIGRKCLFSFNVSVLDHDHLFGRVSSPVDSGLTSGEPVVIGDHTFVGAHSFILKGVKLGKYSVVGANSVVTKSFPDYSLIAGNPAKLIKKLKIKR